MRDTASALGRAAPLLALTLAMLLAFSPATTGSVPHSASPAISPPPAAPPIGVPVPGPSLYNAHYWDGAVYDGASTTADQLSVELTVPDDTPDSTNTYYVLLSAWDNAQSYDQIGFSNFDGVWGLLYSSSTTCAASYIYDVEAIPLARGTTYVFQMSIASGVLTFQALNVTGGLLWSHTADTGGSLFEVDNLFTCTNGNRSYGLTDYEEVYLSTQDVPSYDFFFHDNAVAGAPEENWTPFSSGGPSGVKEGISGANVTVENQPFSTAFAAPGGDWLQTGNETTLLAVQFTLAVFHPAGTITFNALCLPSGWSLSFQPSTATTNTTVNVTLSIPAGTLPGSYCARLNATAAGAGYTLIRLNVTLSASLNPALSANPPSVDTGRPIGFQLTDPACGSTAMSCLGVFTLGAGLSWETCSVAATVLSSPYTYPGAGDYLASGTVAEYDGGHCRGNLTQNATVAPLVVLVTPPPVASILASSATVDVGQLVTFQASVMNGSGGFSYAWADLPPGCSETGVQAQCFPTAAEKYNISLMVTDSSGVSSNASLPYEVYALPSVGLPGANPSSGGVDAGQRVNFTSAVPTGGYGTYAYSWVELPAGCKDSGSATEICAPAEAGTFPVELEVVDQNAGAGFSPVLNFTVVSDPEISVPRADPPSLTVGQVLNLSVTTGGGSGGDDYSWSGLPPGCPALNEVSFSCAPSASGVFAVSVIVRDSNRFQAKNGSVTLRIAPALALASEEFEPASLTLGSSTTLTINVTGGMLPYSVVLLGLPPGCTSNDSLVLQCTPSAGGDYGVTVQVTDANGASVNGTVQLVVHAPPGPGPLAFFTPWIDWIVVGVVALVVVAVVVALLRRQKGSPDGPSSPPPPPSTGGTL